MTETIKSVYQFDFVHDGQKVFRQLLLAVANPGQIKTIGPQAGKFEGEYRSLLALGCTLLDNEEKMYVEKNPRLSSELHSLTLCREEDLDRADYIILSSEMNYGSVEQILKNIKHGTYEDPQESATVILLCSRIGGEDRLCLKGPGVDGELTMEVYPYIRKVIEIRDVPQSHEETKVSDAPKTGDNTNIWLPILLLLISAGGMAGLYISRKKIRKQ